MTEITGIDHIYIAVSDLRRSEEFYDTVMKILGFRKSKFTLDGEPHIQYYNRHFGYVLRPAPRSALHDPYAVGMHHLCLRVNSSDDVEAVANKLAEAKIKFSPPKLYPQYAEDYCAIYFSDPDGIQLEITNYRAERKQRYDNWNAE